jgi:eukaryotic-like serine/threonine-protein kinase
MGERAEGVLPALQDVTVRPGLRLDAVIAHGSFGTVFRAHQLAVDRDVAVKVLDAGFARSAATSRLFRDEIRAIGTIDHRNVVRIYDADHTADGRSYFVMELLSGPTMQDLADTGLMPPPRAIALVGQLLDGLAAAHTAGHIHADVKPSNAVVVEESGRERVVLIDFGLSRLHRAGHPTEAVGGTHAYMAPEQLRAWQVDARSDVFSAALVLIRLVTGWQRASAAELMPPLDGISDPALRIALARALSIDPASRPSAADFARALRGGEPEEAPAPGPPPPFRDLAPFTERDRGRLCGREEDVVRLMRRIALRSAVVIAAPPGTGKTSLLRAGLMPYLDAAGIGSVYVACEPGALGAIVEAIAPGARSIREAIDAWNIARPRRLVLILDQLERILVHSNEVALLAEILGVCVQPQGDDVAVVLSVREDFVARLLAATPVLTDGAPQVRLRPLDRDAARAALIRPLAEHGVAMEEALLDQLLDDLVRAGAELGDALGWSGEAVIYPPHLQLVGSTLFGALDSRSTTLTLAHYRALGCFDAIVGEYLDRCLGGLSAEDHAVARDLFLALVASGQTREIRGEAELLDSLGTRHGDTAVHRVLGRLEAQRLVARRNAADGTLAWSLVHDTLVPRIEAWLTVQDLERRRAAELLRFHLRQSRPKLPSILTARQLRLVERHPGVVEELEAEWRRRRTTACGPLALIARSRQVARYRRGVIAGATGAVLLVTLLLVARWLDERHRRERTETLIALDRGRFDLTLAPFDWDRDPLTGALIQVSVNAAQLHLEWSLHEPDAEDSDREGRPMGARQFVHGSQRLAGGVLVETGAEVRSGDAFLVVTGRGRHGESCPPSVMPLRRLPGYDVNGAIHQIRIRVPTCRATWFETVTIPGGPFYWDGLEDPAASEPLPIFAVDRTEVTTAAFDVFAAMAQLHGVWVDATPSFLGQGPDYPRGNVDWFDARAYCRFLGKDLPSSKQWQKALRGGLELPTGPNPFPRRSLPWGYTTHEAKAGIANSVTGKAPCDLGQEGDRRQPSPVGTHPDDRSPYGVLDLAGSVQEWLSDARPGPQPLHARPRPTRGGNWFDTPPGALIEYLKMDNLRSPRARYPFLGMRCATLLE